MTKYQKRYFKIEDQLFIVTFHLRESSEQGVSIKILRRESNDIRCTMVRKEQEHIVISCSPKDSSCSFSSHCSYISLQNIQEHCGSDVTTLIVDFDASVDIGSRLAICGLIVDLTWERVTGVVCNVIIGKHNNSRWVKILF